MNERRSIRAGLLLILAFLALVAGWSLLGEALFPSPAVTTKNFDRLHSGMSLKQVEAVLGPPIDDGQYTTDCMTYIWVGNGCAVVIHFLGGEKAFYGSLRRPDGSSTPLADEPEPLFAPLRKWLRTIGW